MFDWTNQFHLCVKAWFGSWSVFGCMDGTLRCLLRREDKEVCACISYSHANSDVVFMLTEMVPWRTSWLGHVHVASQIIHLSGLGCEIFVCCILYLCQVCVAQVGLCTMCSDRS